MYCLLLIATLVNIVFSMPSLQLVDRNAVTYCESTPCTRQDFNWRCQRHRLRYFLMVPDSQKREEGLTGR